MGGTETVRVPDEPYEKALKDDVWKKFLTTEGNFNTATHKTIMLVVELRKKLHYEIDKAALFQATKKILKLKVDTYFDYTNVLAIIKNTDDPMIEFEIDMTEVKYMVEPFDAESPFLTFVISSIRTEYYMFITRAVGGIEHEKQHVFESRQSGSIEWKNPQPSQSQKRGFWHPDSFRRK